MTVAGIQAADTDPARGRPTVYDLRAAKGRRQLLELHVDNAEEAAAAELAELPPPPGLPPAPDEWRYGAGFGGRAR